MSMSLFTALYAAIYMGNNKAQQRLNLLKCLGRLQDRQVQTKQEEGNVQDPCDSQGVTEHSPTAYTPSCEIMLAWV